ncbi:T9SS type A sorting domain-containing protein [Hymenobacter latericus]|uniref:T9SS type A sorting domain-containing protein n=1 Tax=Hymenobacter sp. YIM 151858-1 TaxID=2987688 RepID=UPI0022276115|nr:T9SS type A sorting domain-containing protein [Hymenobacter sp. YIM 151858-1]UYZ59240.1 T9SS type A sorting domain-containing protein [Hymenobacter sp. YIM 151858-1]
MVTIESMSWCALADVATTLTGPATLSPGASSAAYTVTYANNGPDDAVSTTRTVSIPANAVSAVTAPGGTVTGSQAGGWTITYPGGTYASGNSVSYNFAITPLSTYTGNLTVTSNTGTATSQSSTTNDQATVTLNVAPVADVTVSLAGPTTLYAGQPTGTYTATFTNEGPNTATAVTRTVTLPAGATLTSAQQDAIRAAYPTASFPSATTINFGSVASLANDASSTVTFAFTAPATIGNSLTLAANTGNGVSQGANLAPDQAALTLGTVAVADVRAAISATLTNATTGTFNVTFSNNDQLTAAGVAYTVQLPAGLNVGLNVVTASNSGTYDNTTGLVTYPTAATTLAANGSFASAISYPLANSQGMPVTATARVSTTSDEAGRQGNNVAVATMAPSFDLTTTLSGSATAVAGSPTTLFVTTTNNGTNQAGNATQTVNIGANLNNVYVTNGGTYDRNTGVVTFPTLLNLPAGQTVTNSISFTAPSGNFTPTAAVSTTSPNETTTSNNSAALNGVVGTGVVVSPATASAANVATSIATTSTVVAPGASVTYSVTATNNGPVAATNVVERVQLLPGLTTGTLQVSGTTGVLTGNVITFGTAATYNTTTGVLQYATVNTLSVGATQSFANITVTAPANTGNNGQLLATASVASTTSDNVPADNVASVTVKVNTKAEVATVVNGPSSTTAGLPVTYSVSFTSGGAADAANVVETAQLPAGLSNVVVTDATGAVVANAYNSTTGLVTFPALAADAVGATQTFSIQLVAPGQNFQVISAIRSVTADGTVLNNTAQQSTAVTANADLAVAISGPEVSVIGNAVTYVVTTTNNGPTTATSVVPTLQLPAGLTLVAQSSGSTYTTGTGLLTFGTTATLLPGTSVVNYVTFTMPANPTGGLISGVASASTATTDAVSSNNTAALTTSVAPATVEVANMLTSISVSSNPVPAGSTITYTIAYRNDGSGSGVGSAATDVVPTASLPAGLSASTLQVGGSTGTQSGDIITFSNVNVNGATYNVKTGLLTFPTIASAAASTSANASYTVSFPAPNGGQLVVTSQVASATSDNVLSNNTATSSVTINTSYDVTTLLAGPATALAGSTNTYTVTTLNNGASATSTATTQTVTLPAGVTATNISGNGSQTGSVITWTVPLGQTAGATNEVVNTFSLTMPNSGSLTLTAAVNNANDSNTGNNSATLTTAQANLAPVAQNVWNTLQSVRGNTAGTLLISALNASDADGSITSYTIVTLPLASQGVLYYNGSLATAGQVITDATKLSFDADAAFVGNATFSYLATDNLGQTSPAALYTIPVAQDQNSTYASTPVKGGATPYQNGDLIASTFDVNTGSYSLSGSTAVVNKNGIGSAVLATGSNPLPAGLALDAVTGAITVADRTKLVTGNYTVIIVTVDANGGTNSVQVPLTIGTRPLPVELVEFAAKTQNADALLTWKTAQEKNNDRFEVERSTDGVRFEKVGQVAGHGTTSAPQTYAYTDANAGTLATQVYYRLKQVDRDGTTAYSPVRTVAFGKELGQNGIALYPNPAHDELSVSLGATAPNATLEVYTVNGMFVRKQSFGAAATTKLNVSTLPQGTYLLKVTTATGTVLTSRFVKH